MIKVAHSYLTFSDLYSITGYGAVFKY